MPNKYDQIDFCLNTIYDYYYNKDTSQCYNFTPIIKKEIKIENIKKEKEFDYSHIFNEKINFIGKYNEKYYFKRHSSTSHSCNIVVSKYSETNPNNNDLERRENVDLARHYIISEYISRENFKFSMIPIMNFEIKHRELVKSNKIFESAKFSENDNLLICVQEHYFKMTTLKEYLNENLKNMTNEDWVVLLFQILYAIHKITDRMIGFRHNMLNLESIWIYARNDLNENYKIGTTEYTFSNCKFDIKITNYDYSHSKDYYKNKDTMGTLDNTYYDVHYILTELCNFLKEKKYTNNLVDKFIDEIIPEKLKVSKNPFTGMDEGLYDEIPTSALLPVNVLKKNNIFLKFIKSHMTNERIKSDVSKYSNKDAGINYGYSAEDVESVTDPVSDYGRGLALQRNNKNYKNKKTSHNIINDMKGSRKLNLPKIKEYSLSESDVFDEMESKYENKDHKREIKRLKNDIDEKHSKKDKRSNDSEESSEKSENISKTKKNKKHKSKHDDSDSSEAIDSDVVKMAESMYNKNNAFSNHTQQNMMNQMPNMMNQMPNMMNQMPNSGMIPANVQANIMNSLPSGFEGELPEQYKAGLPQMTSNGMGNGVNGMGSALGIQNLNMANQLRPKMSQYSNHGMPNPGLGSAYHANSNKNMQMFDGNSQMGPNMNMNPNPLSAPLPHMLNQPQFGGKSKHVKMDKNLFNDKIFSDLKLDDDDFF